MPPISHASRGTSHNDANIGECLPKGTLCVKHTVLTPNQRPKTVDFHLEIFAKSEHFSVIAVMQNSNQVNPEFTSS